MSKQNKQRKRQYTGVLQYFHNFEHDALGRNHCHSDGNYPYRIYHSDGKHVITSKIACGHGKGSKPQWFKFTQKLDKGWDVASGVRISKL